MADAAGSEQPTLATAVHLNQSRQPMAADHFHVRTYGSTGRTPVPDGLFQGQVASEQEAIAKAREVAQVVADAMGAEVERTPEGAILWTADSSVEARFGAVACGADYETLCRDG
jgi:hypothetical protein